MKKKIEQLAKQLGATLVITSDEITCEAPKGCVWACTGDIHEIVIDFAMMCENRQAAYRQLYRDMKMGVEKCLAKNCEWCSD